jgi:hypothetical protein
MKKTTSSLIIVIVLIVMAPLVGYFGTKFILISLFNSSPTEQVESPIDEDIPDSTASEVTTYSITLPEKVIYAVQVASLSSEGSAKTFVTEAEVKGVSCMVMEKGDQYKAIHSGYFDSSNLSEILSYAKDTYSDAFITQKTLSQKTLEIDFDSQEKADAFQDSVNNYFEIMKSSDDYASALFLGQSPNGQEMASQLKGIITLMGDAGENAEDFLQIITMTEALYSTENSDYNEYNEEYLAILQQIFETY